MDYCYLISSRYATLVVYIKENSVRETQTHTRVIVCQYFLQDSLIKFDNLILPYAICMNITNYTKNSDAYDKIKRPFPFLTRSS